MPLWLGKAITLSWGRCIESTTLNRSLQNETSVGTGDWLPLRECLSLFNCPVGDVPQLTSF